jgi:hypothetical protein
MATPDGKVTFEAGGRPRVLQFTTNRLCLLEDKVDKPTLDIALELSVSPSIRTIRAMLWAGLGEGDMTLAAAGEIMDELGKSEAIALVRDAFAAAFPEQTEGKEGEAHPPVAAAG